MALAAAYDEIADWYEEKFSGVRPAGTGIGDSDSLGIGRALHDLLGQGSGVCLEIGCGTGAHATRVRALGWTPAASTSPPGCCGTRGAACRSRGLMPAGCRSGTAASPPRSR